MHEQIGENSLTQFIFRRKLSYPDEKKVERKSEDSGPSQRKILPGVDVERISEGSNRSECPPSRAFPRRATQKNRNDSPLRISYPPLGWKGLLEKTSKLTRPKICPRNIHFRAVRARNPLMWQCSGQLSPGQSQSGPMNLLFTPVWQHPDRSYATRPPKVSSSRS
jgi:hypothetical protein